MSETVDRATAKPVTPKLTFLFRFASTVALWSIALLIIFSGYEIAFFGLIAAFGLLGRSGSSTECSITRGSRTSRSPP